MAQAPNDISRVEDARPTSQPCEDLKTPTNAMEQKYGVTHRGLKSRHVQLMVIGGNVGVGLWVSISSNITNASWHIITDTATPPPRSASAPSSLKSALYLSSSVTPSGVSPSSGLSFSASQRCAPTFHCADQSSKSPLVSAVLPSAWQWVGHTSLPEVCSFASSTVPCQQSYNTGMPTSTQQHG